MSAHLWSIQLDTPKGPERLNALGLIIYGDYSGLGIFLGGIAIDFGRCHNLAHGPGGPDLRPFIAVTLCPRLGYAFLSLALGSKVILTGDRLTVIYAVDDYFRDFNFPTKAR